MFIEICEGCVYTEMVKLKRKLLQICVLTPTENYGEKLQYLCLYSDSPSLLFLIDELHANNLHNSYNGNLNLSRPAKHQ